MSNRTTLIQQQEEIVERVQSEMLATLTMGTLALDRHGLAGLATLSNINLAQIDKLRTLRGGR